MTCSGLGDRPGHGCHRSAGAERAIASRRSVARHVVAEEIERGGASKMNFEVMASGAPGGVALRLPAGGD